MKTGICIPAMFLLSGLVMSYGQVSRYKPPPRPFKDTPLYPEWNPGEQICPLHPTNALFLATHAASKAFAGVKTWTLSSLSLQMTPLRNDSGIWFYEITLSPGTGEEVPRTETSVTVAVGLDGYVPEIKKGRSASGAIYAEDLKRRREKLRKERMYRQLVIEGVLPPPKKNEKKVQPEN